MIPFFATNQPIRTTVNPLIATTVTCGKTPVLSAGDAYQLLDSIQCNTLIEPRDQRQRAALVRDEASIMLGGICGWSTEDFDTSTFI